MFSLFRISNFQFRIWFLPLNPKSNIRYPKSQPRIIRNAAAYTFNPVLLRAALCHCS